MPVESKRQPASQKALRVLVVDDQDERIAVLRDGLAEAGAVLAGVARPDEDLIVRIAELRPDMVVLDLNAPSRDMLEDVATINRDRPLPIVVFTGAEGAGLITEAIAAGVSAYVVDGLERHRVKPVIEVAIARFRAFDKLRRELDTAKAALSDRKVIERAKGILMEQRGLNEEEAYRALRKLAMDQNKRLVDVAEGLITYASLLKG